MLNRVRLMSSAVPPAVRNWLKSQYRDAPIKETWLVETVRNGSKEGNSPAALVQHVKQTLLNSSLSKSLEKGTLPASSTKTKKAVLAGPILLEIVGKLDIGVSAQTQLDVLEARRQARLTIGGLDDSTSKAEDTEDQTREDTDHMADFNATEEAASLPATVFPRSTIQLTLSDGFNTVTAIEHKRVASLSMTDPPMGAKVVLKGAKMRQGYILLAPDCIDIKGGKVDELDNKWETELIDTLRARLGKEPLQKEKAGNKPQPQGEQNLAVQRPTTNATSPPSSILAALDAQDEDEEAEAAALFEELHRRDTLKRPNDASKPGASKQLKLPPKTPKKVTQNSETTVVKSPYFADKSADHRKSAIGEGEEDEFEMLDMNDLDNPIVLSDSD